MTWAKEAARRIRQRPAAPRDLAAYDWATLGRPEQQAPPGDWRVWLVMSGRGWGKTRTGAEWVRREVERNGVGLVHLVGRTAADVRDVMVGGPSGLLATAPPWFRPRYEPSKRLLTWPNGATALTFSAEEPDQMRGPQATLGWADELASWFDPDAWTQLSFGMRIAVGDYQPRILVTTTPRPTALVKSLLASPSTVVPRGRTADNAANLAPTFLAEIEARYGGTRLWRQEAEGELLEAAEGALWSQAQLDGLRVTAAPGSYERVVVAIDPATTSGEESDETGIVVVGYTEGALYVLADESGRHAPAEWAARAGRLAAQHGAAAIVAESNQGGEMVRSTLVAARVPVPIRLVHASKGKLTRAEPVSLVFEQRRAHLVGRFPALEGQMTSYDGTSGSSSPDRLDALVWACTDLLPLVLAYQPPAARGPTVGSAEWAVAEERAILDRVQEDRRRQRNRFGERDSESDFDFDP